VFPVRYELNLYIYYRTLLSWYPEFHVALRASHAALPMVTSKFRPNVALPMLVQFSQ
jgi:hypothetical protein